MTTSRLIGLAALLLSQCRLLAAHGQAASKQNYLHVASPILFAQKPFALAWSSHPSPIYYKQEYLPKGENLEKFSTLLTLDLVMGDIQVKDAVAVKINDLEKRKASDPLVHYQVFEKEKEVIIDFIMSQDNPANPAASIVERNVYRYQHYEARNGQKGVLLFAASERAYGAAIDSFLGRPKANRQRLLNDVGAFTIPRVALAD